MPELSLRRVAKTFADAVAVDDLSLTIKDGEFVCLLGPSGCGKSTTLRLIAGFEQPDHGAILLDGEDITGLPPQKRDFGLVFQHYALFPHMTVAQNVGYGLKMRRLSGDRIAREVEAALDLVRLREFAGRYPNQLSGGQQQRVALARALAIRPRLLLMDEPLSNLDAKLRDEMRVEIRQIQRRVGITTIFVTHDQAEAFALADRIGVMADGRLRQMDEPAAIYDAPANATVGNFIGQVNAFTGSVEAIVAGGARIATAEGFALAGVGEGLKQGADAIAIVKQERVQLSRERPAAADNLFSCRIDSRTFLGNNIGYQFSVEGEMIVALLPNHPVFPQFSPGETVFAHWASADCRIFPL